MSDPVNAVGIALTQRKSRMVTKPSAQTARLVMAVGQTLCPLKPGYLLAKNRNKLLAEGIELSIECLKLSAKNTRVQVVADYEVPEAFKVERPFWISADDWSFLTVEVDFSKSDLDQISNNLSGYWVESDDNRRRAVEYSVGDYLRQIAKHVVVAANISKPNSINIHNAWFEFNESRKIHNIENYSSNIGQSIWYCEENYQLRLTRELPFSKVWDWYCRLNGTLAMAPDTELEVAVSNFTHLFDDRSDSSGARDLVWSFAGLEALLAESESGVTSQLRNKLIAIFGNQVDIKDFDKSIKTMYQQRSNIVHGKMKLKSPIQQDKIMGSESKSGDVYYLAMYLLVSLIQYCCQNRLSEIRFKTVVI
jgi:hypothetical protein